MEKLLTIVIPAYNCEKTIEKTVKSIQEQTCDNFKILIVNDGSKDKSLDIIKNLSAKDDRISFLTEENKGVSAARNLGIVNVDTKYISFLDADDLYEKDFVKKMLVKIEKEKSDLVVCGYYKEEDNKKVIVKSHFSKKDFLFKYILGENKFHTSSFLISHKFLIENNIYFNEKSSWGEDIEFFTKILAKTEKISIVNEYLTVYEAGQENSLSSFSLDKLEKDKFFVESLVNNEEIDLSKKVKDLLIEYKLPGLLTYRLLKAIKYKYPKEEIKERFCSYKENIDKFSFKYGLRSIKLFINICLLKKKISSY
jgi:glycosyltransferase involved in cell wall biosynthesis